MNTSVFPPHAKSFEKKLVSSGWDIPLYETPPTRISDMKNGLSTVSMSTKTKKPLSTGFSGTNDNRLLLPLTITQQDLPQLSHTNAEVLTYLLEPRNREVSLAATSSKKRLTERQLLLQLYQHQPTIRVLIDCGAQVLELENKALIRLWLDIAP